jgi:hypothetical protein
LVACNSETTDTPPNKTYNKNIVFNEDQQYAVDLKDIHNSMISNMQLSTDDKLIKKAVYNSNNKTVTITPKKDVYGDSKITITGRDVNGINITINISIKINPVNDAPVLSKNNLIIEYSDFDTIVSDVEINDVDSQSSSIFMSNINNENYTIKYINGKIEFTPKKLGLNIDDTVFLEVSDGVDTVRRPINLIVTYNSDNILLTNDSVLQLSINEDTSGYGRIKPLEEYDGQTFTIEYFSNDLDGTLIRLNDYDFQYIPNENFNGVESFIVRITNQEQKVALFQIKITVNPVFDDFTIENNFSNISINEDSSWNESLIIDSVESDSNYQIDVINPPTNGNMIVNFMTLFYEPDMDYYGSDSVTLRVTDTTHNQSKDITIDFTIISELDPLITTNKTIELIKGRSYTEQYTFYDPEESTAEYFFNVDQPQEGSVTINNDGTFTYQSDLNGVLNQDSFEIFVLDSNNNRSDSAVVNIELFKPSTNVVLVEAVEDETLMFNPIPQINKQFIENSDYTVSISQTTTNGLLMINSDHTFNYAPNEHFNGTDYFELEIIDTVSMVTHTLSIQLNVEPVNDPLNDENVLERITTLQNKTSTYQIDLIDPDNSAQLQYNVVANGQKGTASINNAGLLTYTPELDESGEDSIVVRVTDGLSDRVLDIQLSVYTIPVDTEMEISTDLPDYELYNSMRLNFNLSEYIVNPDETDYFLFGQTIVDYENNIWETSVKNNQLRVVINGNTGEIEIFPAHYASGYYEITIGIQRVPSQAIEYLTFEIYVEPDLGYINSNSADLQIDLDDAILNNDTVLFCPGDYDISSDLIINNNANIIGADFNFGLNESVDIFYACNTTAEKSIININGASLLVNENVSMKGFHFQVESDDNVIIKKETPTTEIDYLTLKNNVFNFSMNQNKALLIENRINHLIVENNEVYSDQSGYYEFADIDELYQSLSIKNNLVENIDYFISIDTIDKEFFNLADVDTNTIYQVKYPFVFRDLLNSDEDFNNNPMGFRLEFTNNLIESSVKGLIIEDLKVDGNTVQPNNYVIIDGNTIESEINSLDIGIDQSPYNLDLSITNNTLSSEKEATIKLIDFWNSYNNKVSTIDIADNVLNASGDSFSVNHAGLLVYLDYRDTSPNNDTLVIRNYNFNNTTTMNIENNIIGFNDQLIESTNKYSSGGILVKRDLNEYIDSTMKYTLNLNLINNDVQGNKGIVFDYTKNNTTIDELNIVLNNNRLYSNIPSMGFTIKEKYLTGCLDPTDNTINGIFEVSNEDSNSTMTLREYNNQGFNTLYSPVQEYVEYANFDVPYTLTTTACN